MVKVVMVADIDLSRLHDVMVEIDGKSRTEQELLLIFESLPQYIRNIAYQWGGGDTVFGDEAYVYLRDKK